MARPAGFEPTTPWFVARYSIQLSYGRKDGDYIRASERYEVQRATVGDRPGTALNAKAAPEK